MKDLVMQNKYVANHLDEVAKEMAHEHLEGCEDEDVEEQIKDLMVEIRDGCPRGDDDLDFDMGFVEGYGQAMRDILFKGEHLQIRDGELTNDDTRDIAIKLIDKLITIGFLDDDLDTDDETNFEIQDDFHRVINKYFKIKED